MAAAKGAEDEVEMQPLSEPLIDFSNMGRTADGSGLAYRTAACAGKHLNSIKGIEAYTHLQHLDLSTNGIKDKELALLKGLSCLLKLNLAENLLTTLKFLDQDDEGTEVFPHMTYFDVSGNALTELRPLTWKSLRIANFAGNEIATCADFPGHEALESLDLSGNKLTALAGVANLPQLSKLNLSGNQITDLAGLAGLPLISDLNLAANQLEALNGPWAELAAAPLQLVDVSGNQLASAQPLEGLRSLAKLRSLAVKGNPFVEELGEGPAYTEVLVCHWRLKSIDDKPVTDEMLEQARQLNVARMEEARERAKAEEAAAAS